MRSVRIRSCAEISLAAIVRRNSRTQETARLRMRDTTEMALAKFGAEIIFPRIGETMLSRSVQATGSAIGIAAAITSGADIIADSSAAPGSSSTSDFIRGGHTGTPRTIITLTIIIRINT